MHPSILTEFVRETLECIASVLLPAGCPICEALLLKFSSVPVCTDCLESIRPGDGAWCGRCGESFGLETEEEADRVCRRCSMAPPAFAQAVAYGSYADELRDILHIFKFEGVRSLDTPLGYLLAKTILANRDAWPQEMTVVAVPLFRSKRHFNHSAVLADSALAHIGKEAPEWRLAADHRLLTRIRRTESQFELSLTGRRRNVRGAFAVPDPANVKGKDILLVDDILTTGATARECARVLMRAGAASVRVATLARTQSQSAERWLFSRRGFI